MSAHARVYMHACMILIRTPLVYVRVRMHGYALEHVRMVIVDCHFSLRGNLYVFQNVLASLNSLLCFLLYCLRILVFDDQSYHVIIWYGWSIL